MDSFFGIGIGELFFIAILALIILGPERLPGAFREFAKYFRYVRNLSSELTSQFSEEMKGLEDLNPQNLLKELTEDPAEKPKKKSGTAATKSKTATKTSTAAKSSTAAKKTTATKPAATGQKSATTADTAKSTSTEPSADTQGATVDAPVTETEVTDAATEAVTAAGAAATTDQQASAADKVEHARDDLDAVDPDDMAKSAETLPEPESIEATKDAASEQKREDHQTPVIESAAAGQIPENKTVAVESLAQSDSSSVEAGRDSDTMEESATGGSSITAERESSDGIEAQPTKDGGQATNVHGHSEPETENRILPPQSAAQEVSSHESAVADRTEQAGGGDGTVPRRPERDTSTAAEDETVIEPAAATRRPVVNVNGKTADVEGEG